MVAIVRDEDRLLQLLAGQRCYRAAVAQRGDERIRARRVQHLHDFALDVHFAGVAQHPGQRRSASQAVNPLRPVRDRGHHGQETVGDQFCRHRIGDHLRQRLQ